MQNLDLALKFLNDQTPFTWKRTTLGGNYTAYMTEPETEFGAVLITSPEGFAPENWGEKFNLIVDLEGVVMFQQLTTIGEIHSLEFENCLDCGAIVAYNSVCLEWFHSDDYELNTCFLARRSGERTNSTTTTTQKDK